MLILKSSVPSTVLSEHWAFGQTLGNGEGDGEGQGAWPAAAVGLQRAGPSLVTEHHCGLADKESACHGGDLGLIPGWKEPLEKGQATHSSIMAWRIAWTVQSWGHKDLDTSERPSLTHEQQQQSYQRAAGP